MHRYLVTRSFPDGLNVPLNDDGRAVVDKVVRTNSESDVHWVHSYVSVDRTTTYCIYDGPDPEAIREVAGRNGLPVDSIAEVHVLDPHFYTAG